MENNNQRSSLGMLITSMVIFGTIGIFRRYTTIPSAPLALARSSIGMVSLLVILALLHRRLDFKAIRANLVLLLFSGIFLGINWILLFEAYNYTTVAVATLCYHMAPVMVLLVSPVLLGERLTPKKLGCVVVAVIGMALVSGVLGSRPEDLDLTGILYGLGAAVFYASVILCNKKIRNIPAYDKTIMQLAAATAIMLPYVLLTGLPAPEALTPVTIGLVLVMGLVHTGIAYALYFGSMEALPAQTVALFSYIDSILAILLSALILSEKLGVREILGAVCVLGAMIFSELPERRSKQ